MNAETCRCSKSICISIPGQDIVFIRGYRSVFTRCFHAQIILVGRDKTGNKRLVQEHFRSSLHLDFIRTRDNKRKMRKFCISYLENGAVMSHC